MLLRYFQIPKGRCHGVAELSLAAPVLTVHSDTQNSHHARNTSILKLHKLHPKLAVLSADSPKQFSTRRQIPDRDTAAQTLDQWIESLRSTHRAKLHNYGFWRKAFIQSEIQFGKRGIVSTLQFFSSTQDWRDGVISLYHAPSLFQLILDRGLHYDAEHRTSPGDESLDKSPQKRLLQVLCDYLHWETTTHNKRPPSKLRVYNQIIKGLLLNNPTEAELFHDQLSTFWPSRAEITDMIVKDLKTNKIAHETFRRFCFSLPHFHNMYEEVVPSLCTSHGPGIAASWHRELLKEGHLPANANILEPLIERSVKMKQTRWTKHLRKIDLELKTAKLDYVHTNIEQRFPQGKVKRSVWNDESWARVFATRFLSLHAVRRCLAMFEVDTIGSLSMREILLRSIEGGEMSITNLRAHLRCLNEAGIHHDGSTFCRLVDKWVVEGNDLLLQDIATCDVHPDEFGNSRVQESLLAHYSARHDTMRIERTLAALLLDSTDLNKTKRLLNLLLRRSIAQNDEAEVNLIIQQMQASCIPVERPTLQEMFKKLIPERTIRQMPSNGQVQRLIRLWCSFMNYRRDIPPRFWDDILRTLLIQGDMETHEDLCLRLVRWYSTPDHKAKYDEGGQDRFESLFRPQCITEILTYSLHHGCAAQGLELSKALDPQERASVLASHPVLRGLRLLLRLRENGVGIELPLIQEILRKRVWRICTPRGLSLLSGVTVRRLPNANERDYHRATEILIGERDRQRNSRDRRHRKVRKLARLDAQRLQRPVLAPGATR